MGVIEEDVGHLFPIALVLGADCLLLNLLVDGRPLLWSELQPRGDEDAAVEDQGLAQRCLLVALHAAIAPHTIEDAVVALPGRSHHDGLGIGRWPKEVLRRLVER
eukprot:7114566-Lingulodinium_polyedra.AAC.1